MIVPTTHVLLDLDGTLTDSEPGIGRSLRYAFAECGYPEPTDEMIRSMIGPPFEVSFPEHGIDVHDIEQVIEAYRVRYEDVGLFENRLYDGVIEMMDELKSAGHTLTLATAKPEHLAVRITEHFGLTPYFRTQVGSSVEIGSGRRTKAEVITEAFNRLGVSSHDRIALDHVVMIGDRDHDVEGAHMNAIDCIGVSWGFGSHDELRHAGARVVVDTPAEVVPAVAATYRSRES
ncbi:HAD hydrolase-like protein [Ilumatobacter coccineus]|uniref:Phosphatase n=1 Tax=Ilumatobacter coccineus (strain NBRC 103263 / KCTC 29153 / YM16-304) TaxID=1313172 RepID=A0A6C7EAY8_ILUCY|nr:HAD hydrolase-like protein [Ilumatobacter coccineus]BAN03641.1 phosphatase [Ilumatobacter coccineus YM16-304]